MLQAIKDVLGDAANDEIIEGWTEGYSFLANVLIEIENKRIEERNSEIGKKKRVLCVKGILYLFPPFCCKRFMYINK